ncbi:vWA domain-containing protein [Pseudonocardia xinjiangensis]|nr:VWA domain-containing protein [Pseudonocardia xinjiangensis]
MRTLTRIMITALAGGLLLAPLAPSAHAQSAAAPSGLAPTMVVLDASGSMTGADPAGGTKMDAAKRAVHALVDAAPAQASIGLAVYGTSTGNSAAERERGCQDITVLRGPVPVDKAALGSAVDGIVPRGYTPIGRSLQVAAGQLPPTGPRAIVLVSDGEDTCAPPPPCDVVRTLAGQGVDLVVHAVGFGVDDAARAQLSCIAQTTGGTYSDAPDAEALQRILPRVTAAAMRNYEPAGTPITGTPTSDTAPVAAPGQHLDTIGQHEKRYYAVDVPEGATAYVSATVSYPHLRGIEPQNDNNVLQWRTYGAGGEDCNEFEFEQATNSSDGAALTAATTWDGATEKKTGSAGGDSCKGGGRYYFALQWDRVSDGVPARMPVELLVQVEPPVLDAGPAGVLSPAVLTEPTGAPRPTVGGGSLNVAGILDGFGRYTDTLQRGEFVFYRVHLDWGQALAYRVRFGETPSRGVAGLSLVTTRLYAPSRKQIAWDFSMYNGSAYHFPASQPAFSTVPVRYGNRTAEDQKVRTQSEDGWYYISVQLGPSREDIGPAPVPIQLDLSVTGTPEAGPRYATVVAPPSVGTPGPGAGAPGAAAQGHATTVAMVSPLGWTVTGAVAVLVVAVATALVVRGRRRARSANR